MSQNKVKILVACHKPDKVFKNEVYTPIHVGRAVSKYKEEMKDMIGDDTGDNISDKNPNFCELTAQYWAWKNLDSEYVGLCHYRRYFATEITENNIDGLLGEKYDMVLCTPIHESRKTGEHILRATCLEDVYIFLECLKKVQPDYYATAMKVLSGNIFTPYNMFVMKKTLFEKFASWQFSVLFEMENYVKLSGYSRMRRLYGYMSEIMLYTYAIHHHFKVNYIPMQPMDENGDFPVQKTKRLRTFRSILSDWFYSRGKFSLGDVNAIRVGLKNDGIQI